MFARDDRETVALVHAVLTSARSSGDQELLADILLQATWLFRRPDLFAERARFVDQLVRLPDDRLTAGQRSTAHTEAGVVCDRIG